MAARAQRNYWTLLLLVPFVALLWVPWYARATPALFGFPFFYWYQIVWIGITVALTALVYRKRQR